MTRRRIAGGGALALVAGVAAVGGSLAGGGDASGGAGGGPATADASGTGRAQVERRDLVERETVSGTLGYADGRTLTAGRDGVVTRLAREGARVRRGGTLARLDESPVTLLYGSVPAYRPLTPATGDGDDVRQLEANLRRLGHDPDGTMTVDGEWTEATTAAVKRFQREEGLARDGALEPGDVVFLPGPVRVAGRSAEIGSRVTAGGELLETTSTRRAVSVELDAEDRDLAREGGRVELTLPDGSTLRGRVVRISTTAEGGSGDGGSGGEGGGNAPGGGSGGDDEDPTHTATVALLDRVPGRLDGAPVDVGFEAEAERDALSVPVTALLALDGGGYGVEVLEGGRRRLVAVRTGRFADGYVAVEGRGLREGDLVAVPR